ncbi:2-methylcitrate dehydratase [Pseudoclavibacter endophyticus]|uniref:MmgE/PrpD family protein n=1 Tax=Pseudoclavibacter endophyticus TaxID=1778590 RepID=A0A6H9WMD5_9MICO|nr:MmgE/PrpD family protein [Pseudoclavibacter endophyticus]KAB1646910.1 MmgE/PrpD family protein [Pseudoclavibacter endophyticus]GGA74507.1 2-methylcitrate dehydratase [Pseudoclavibacter endophyticus]
MSTPIIDTLASFATSTSYESLPDATVRSTKRVLLDSIGCALGATTTDPGKVTIGIARQLGGPGECSILGTGDRVAITNAVFANGQLVNLLDFDTVMPGGHTPPYIVPTVLGMAEREGASGRELVVATAVALELSARMARAVPRGMGFVEEDGERVFRYAEREGYARLNFGAAAGAGRLRGLTDAQMVNALAHAGHLSQLNTWSRGNFSMPRNLSKYGFAGWQNTGAILAIMLAEGGIMGDVGLLDDGEHGYGEMSGYGGWFPEHLLPGLGEEWGFDEVRFKAYACCTMLHRAIECFEEIVGANRLHPDEIERVTVYASPTVEAVLFQDRSLNNIVDLQFGTPYMMAMVAHGERSGADWQDWNKLTDPRMTAFADRVSVVPHPDYADNEASKVEVLARGETFTAERYGMTAPLDDAQLVDKFRHNAARPLTQQQIDRAVDALEHLEELDDIRHLMTDLTQ